MKTSHEDGVTILDFSDRITLGEGSVTTRDAVRNVLAADSKKIAQPMPGSPERVV